MLYYTSIVTQRHDCSAPEVLLESDQFGTIIKGLISRPGMLYYVVGLKWISILHSTFCIINIIIRT